MPNIELHGYEIETITSVRARVREALRTSPNANEIVTTMVMSDVEDLRGKKMPFLRIITNPDDLPDLKARLKPLNEDIEVVCLGEWIPAQTSRDMFDELFLELTGIDPVAAQVGEGGFLFIPRETGFADKPSEKRLQLGKLAGPGGWRNHIPKDANDNYAGWWIRRPR